MFWRKQLQMSSHLFVGEFSVNLLTFYRFMMESVFNDEGAGFGVSQSLSIGVPMGMGRCSSFF